MKDLLTIS